MIVHLVTFTWVPSVGAEDVAALTRELRAMADELPMLRSYVCGENLRIRPGADYGVVAVVDDAAALEAYLDSPEHRAVYESRLGPMIESRQAAQLEVESAELT